MEFLAFSILCSVTVSVLLKIARRNHVDIRQAITFNYITAVTLTWFVLQPALPHQVGAQPWGIFIALGILLPTVFLMMFRAVETAGIVRSDAAQRLSLFIPILASFLLFDEQTSLPRLISLAIAFCALLCLLYKPLSDQQSQQAPLFLFLVWVGYGVIDILFKQFAKTGTAFSTGLLITFMLAGILMFLYLFVMRARFNMTSIVAGIILGLFNFGNILFYIRAHQVFKANPTLVFTTMNIGVITLGTIIGSLVFKEKISPLNALGIVLAITAVCLLYFWALRS